MEIITYQDKYKQQIIELILHIQNCEAKINLSVEEQPDLLDIPYYYQKNGGEFFIEKTPFRSHMIILIGIHICIY